MGKNAHLKNGNKATQLDRGSPLFFNQTPPSTEIQETPKKEIQQPTQEIKLQTSTDFLLAAILQELKTQNMIELMKLKAQQEQEEVKWHKAQEMQEQDKARFEAVRNSMYA